jgi:acyl carrier protein
MSSDIEMEIRKMVSEIIEVPIEKLSREADFFKDMNVDSLKAIEIVAAFEKKYRIVVPESDIPKIRNIGQIIEYTRNLKNN